MDLEELRAFCLSLPGATEDVKWGSDLCFLVGGKMFALTGIGNNEFGCSFKCEPETFAFLTERRDVIPAPYLARYHWVAVRSSDTLTKKEWQKYLQASYEAVRAKLPARLQPKNRG